jgi:hypothetical protein
MSFLSNVTAQLPFLKKAEMPEYFFALNIGLEKIKTAVWKIQGGSLTVLNPKSADYSSQEEILEVADRLLDGSLGSLTVEPEKILFGVPDSFLLDEELKEPYLKLLRDVVKSLEVSPMAYVATSHAIAHLLEKQEGGPTTAVLVDIEKEHLSVSVSRAGKIDGTKILSRGDNLAGDVEKALLSFTSIEVLPSRILVSGYSTEGLEKQRDALLSFPWMDKLPFLHFPKIEILPSDIDIDAVALAGAVELNPDVKYVAQTENLNKPLSKNLSMESDSNLANVTPVAAGVASGFVTGDITKVNGEEGGVNDELEKESPVDSSIEDEGTGEIINDEMEDEVPEETDILPNRNTAVSEEEDEGDALPVRRPLDSSTGVGMAAPGILANLTNRFPGLKIPNLGGRSRLFIPVIILLALIAAYLLLPQAEVIVYVEPKILEKDTQVIADPKVKVVDEENRKIPGQIVDTTVSGSEKGTATGKKQVGDPARGKVIIYNGTDSSKTFSSGTTMTTSSGIKFTLTSSVTVASRSASPNDPLSTVSGKSDAVDVTASSIGADGNIPTGTSLSVGSFSQSQVVAKSEGNFSGGTSKDVTVVTDADQKKLLATLASSLRKKAQEDIQTKLAGRKILEEALSEEITKKTYSKAVNDQASDFSLNLTIKYSGIAYSDTDLKMIVSKLVDTNIPEGYQLDLAETETQADVSKIEKDQLVFLARFKAKLAPKLDLEKIKQDIKGQTPEKVGEILRGYENVLESEVSMMPSLPAPLARLPLLASRIKVEVKLK